MHENELSSKLQELFPQAQNAGLTKLRRPLFSLKKVTKIEGYFTSPDKQTTFYAESSLNSKGKFINTYFYLVCKEGQELWHFISFIFKDKMELANSYTDIEHAYYKQNPEGRFLLASEKGPAALNANDLNVIIQNNIIPNLSVDRYSADPAGIVDLPQGMMNALATIYVFTSHEMLVDMTKNAVF